MKRLYYQHWKTSYELDMLYTVESMDVRDLVDWSQQWDREGQRRLARAEKDRVRRARSFTRLAAYHCRNDPDRW